MTEKQLVVSADGHILEPTDLFVTRLPKHLRDRGVWEDDFEIEPLVEGGARIFRRLHTPGFEGWTISRYRQTGGRMPEGDPEIDHRGPRLRRRRRRGHAPEPVALRALLRRPRALHGPRPRLQRLHHRAVHALLLPPGARRLPFRSPTSTMPWPRSSGSPPAASGPSSCRRCRPSPTTRVTSTPCGRRPRPTACTCSSTPRPAG